VRMARELVATIRQLNRAIAEVDESCRGTSRKWPTPSTRQNRDQRWNASERLHSEPTLAMDGKHSPSPNNLKTVARRRKRVPITSPEEEERTRPSENNENQRDCRNRSVTALLAHFRS
jgi:hypothetical protein